jgi:hypothetical protein
MSRSDVVDIACVYIEPDVAALLPSSKWHREEIESRTGGSGVDCFRVRADTTAGEEYVDELALACAEMPRIAKNSAVASAAMDRERRGCEAGDGDACWR